MNIATAIVGSIFLITGAASGHITHDEQHSSRTLEKSSPCLATCDPKDSLTADTLQKCVDRCSAAGHCCGNRLYGEDTTSSAMKLSCANGCEIAFYSRKVDQCKSHCRAGNEGICEYKHPAIPDVFQMCFECACGEWPASDACDYGCEQAKNFPEFYQYDGGDATCETEDIPRFLFGGQSNMEGHTEEAKTGLFDELVEVVLRKGSTKKIKLKEMEDLINLAKESTPGSSKMEASQVFKLKKYIKRKDFMKKATTKAVCSWTKPAEFVDKLDCERPVSPTACGDNYGPELIFAHSFRFKKTHLKNKKIGIIKVAQGGTSIKKNWMKVNVGESENYWQNMVDAIAASKGSIEAFVWFQGENDQFVDGGPASYLENLTIFIADIRNEIYSSSDKFESPEDVPVVICELGNWIYEIEPTIIEAQRAFVKNTPNTALVNTGVNENENKRLSKFYHFNAASQLIIGDRVAKAVTKLLKNK